MRLIRLSAAWTHLCLQFFRDLVLSVKDVLMMVLDPRRPMRAAIVAVPLDVKSDAGITLLANMITLTPGTTSLHVSDDRSTLYVHVMNASDDVVRSIKEGFEASVMKVLP